MVGGIAIQHPLNDSESLAAWAAQTLRSKGIDGIGDWHMLEYWMQAELYRAIRDGGVDGWDHFGGYEQPYVTKYRPKGNKSDWKWADLLLSDRDESPTKLVWFELKDLGRNDRRLPMNARSVGVDLAALIGLRPDATSHGWRETDPHITNKPRNGWWARNATAVGRASHMYAQIVIVPKGLASSVDRILGDWTDACSAILLGGEAGPGCGDLGRAATDRFLLFGLVGTIAEALPAEQDLAPRSASPGEPVKAVASALRDRIKESRAWAEAGFPDGATSKRFAGHRCVVRAVDLVDQPARAERDGVLFHVEFSDGAYPQGVDLEVRFSLGGEEGARAPYVVFYAHGLSDGRDAVLSHRSVTVDDVDTSLSIGEFYGALVDHLVDHERAGEKIAGLLGG
jgi:hypothetical protein